MITWKRWPSAEALLWLPLLTATALAPAVPKMMGLALLLAWLLAWVQARRQPASSSLPSAWRQALAVAALLIGLRLLAAAWHGDGLAERHWELKWLITSLALAVVLRRPGGPEWLLRHAATLWVGTLTAMATLGMAVALVVERKDLVTNAIPWANVMGLVTLALLAQALHSPTSRLRWCAGWGATCASVAIMASHTRGAYTAVVLTLLAWSWLLWQRVLHQARWGALLGIAALVFAMSSAPWMQEAVQHRWLQSVEEWRAVHQQAPTASETSVGARVLLWQHAWTAVQSEPWRGVGIEGRRALIRQWADLHDSATLRALGHVHHEYLHAWLDHGLAGLGAALAMVAVPLALAFRSRSMDPATRWTLVGWAVVVGVSGLTNVNTAHNYYTSGICLLWLLLAMLQVQPNLGRSAASPSLADGQPRAAAAPRHDTM
ncbi:O-antigen ligase family protein [Tepidimonas sediminis]|nr:O-antigen ligase family protein [Tepidimonas sediminis]